MRSIAVLLAGLGMLGSAALASGDKPALAVAVSPDIPPHLTGGASGGLLIQVLRGALPGRDLRFVQVPHEEIETTIGSGKADVAALVQRRLKGIFYSRDYFVFENYAFSKRPDGRVIRAVADLAGKPVLTWQGAWRELGPEFEAMFGPDGPGRGRLSEFVRQKEQVDAFWAREGAVVVIDRNILAHFSRQAGRGMAGVVRHQVFPPRNLFKAGFKDAATRDAFDKGVAALCGSGRYAALLEEHSVVLDKPVCGR